MKELAGIKEFEKLIKASGVSGYEDEIRETIRSLISDLGDTKVDNIGNLILEQPGSGPHIAVAAHMDEIGLVVSNIEDNGFLRVMKIGGVKDSLLPGRHVTIHTSKGPVNGVIGHKAPHLTTDQDKKDEIVPWTSTYVDVGASSAEEVKDLGIDVPDSVTFMKTLRKLHGKCIAGRAMDNRIGCYALIQLARRLKDSNLHLTLVWSVQEEMGLRGAKVVGNTIKPDHVIALDTYTTSDSPGLKSFYKPIELGKGPVLRMVDVRAISSPKMVKHFKKAAEDNDLLVQYGVTGGTTDGMALQEFGPLTIAIGVPVRYSHSTVEVAYWDDITGLVDLLEVGIKGLD
ncbi:MAG: M42 family metallopeptidase [Thermoplasmata archaeon]